MANLLLREVNENVVEFLRSNAKRNKRSLNSEILAVLEQHAQPSTKRIGAIERIEKLSKQFKALPGNASAVDLVREVRDSGCSW